ncbi:hypothetical protein GCM10020221_01890 [Streptomyces thioluteus]|uniref:Methionyl/Valyl/Leucyl/Isoleucyl-tRNA synthetase anticodon-binding domain-containing protein n=1 Tax=Streptomyces thioluteus TaxID=66431 RepID=A0ABP6ITX6_STRTU
MAPLVPFITERVWQDLIARSPRTPRNRFHLSTWPTADTSLIDPELSRQMTLGPPPGRTGRATRAESGVKTRQPLSRALVAAAGFESLSAELRAQITEELNVSSLASSPRWAAPWSTPPPRPTSVPWASGSARASRRWPRPSPPADAASLSLALREGNASVVVDANRSPSPPTRVIITETPARGLVGGLRLGSDRRPRLEITPELRRAGLARDAIRLIQGARKNSGLDVADRIALRWQSTDEEVRTALTDHSSLIADEVLATDFATGEADATFGAPFEDEPLS